MCIRDSYPRHQEMLFDLMFDPHESNNIIDRGDTADIVSDLSSRLDRWMADTGDPLAESDHVAAPKGAKVNNVDGRSPTEEPEEIA